MYVCEYVHVYVCVCVCVCVYCPFKFFLCSVCGFECNMSACRLSSCLVQGYCVGSVVDVSLYGWMATL